jgi:hypothetical protein
MQKVFGYLRVIAHKQLPISEIYLTDHPTAVAVAAKKLVVGQRLFYLRGYYKAKLWTILKKIGSRLWRSGFLNEFIKFSITTMIPPLLQNVRETEKLSFFSPEIAAIIGVEAATVFSKIQWCVENPEMKGMIAPDGAKYIRNPVVCTSQRKLEKSREHGKLVDWLSNFTWASFAKLRRIFTTLEDIGLIIAKKIRAQFWDQCKYYTVNYQKLAELLKRPPLPICSNQTHRSAETDHLDLSNGNKSYQNTFSKKVFQDPHPQEARKPKSTVKKKVRGALIENPIAQQDPPTAQPIAEKIFHAPEYKSESTVTTEVQGLDESSARFSSVNQTQQKDFFYKLLVYAQECVNINCPEGYTKATIRELKSGDPDPIAQLLWEEYLAGEELGSRVVPFGYRLRGVPERIVGEAIAQDQRGKVGATGTEAVVNAARSLAKAPVVRAVADAARLQLIRASEEAAKQEALGIPPERAIANCLPTYATAIVPISSLVAPEPEKLIQGAIGEEKEKTEELILTEELTELEQVDNQAKKVAFAQIKEILSKCKTAVSPRQRIREANLREAASLLSMEKTSEKTVETENLGDRGDGLGEYLLQLEARNEEDIW